VPSHRAFLVLRKREGQGRLTVDPFTDFYTRLQEFPVVKKRLDELQHDAFIASHDLPGADPYTVVVGIYCVCNAKAYPRLQLERIEKRFTKLTKRLEKISLEVQETVLNPPPDLWLWRLRLLKGNFDNTVFDERHTAAEQAIRALKALAGDLHADADSVKSIQRRSREYGTLSWHEELCHLFKYVKRTTGQYREEHVADLLQAACNMLDIETSPDKVFTGEQLKQIRLRHPGL
jgi:hypothetical protein